MTQEQTTVLQALAYARLSADDFAASGLAAAAAAALPALIAQDLVTHGIEIEPDIAREVTVYRLTRTGHQLARPERWN